MSITYIIGWNENLSQTILICFATSDELQVLHPDGTRYS